MFSHKNNNNNKKIQQFSFKKIIKMNHMYEWVCHAAKISFHSHQIELFWKNHEIRQQHFRKLAVTFFLKNTFSLICIFLCSASVFPFFPYFPSFVISFEGFPVVMGSKMAMPPPFHQELALHLEWFHVALSLSHTPFIATNP